MTLEQRDRYVSPDLTQWWVLNPDNAVKNSSKTNIVFLLGPLSDGSTTVNIETRYYVGSPQKFMQTDLYLSPQEARDLGTLLLYHADRAQDNIDRENEEDEF